MCRVPRPLGIKCFTCSKEMVYRDIKGLKIPLSPSLSCKSCRTKLIKLARLGPFIRLCPVCNKQIEHKTKKSMQSQIRKNSPCYYCASTENRVRGEKHHFYGKGKLKTGENNPFYGKKHSEETKKKISEIKELNGYEHFNTPEYKEKRSKLFSGENNPMFGKTVYSVWLEKYGKEEADKKLEEYKKKQSINSSGENNPMYGKPAPIRSGCGWSGWYKGWYFRSLSELSYALSLDNLEIKWRSVESKEFRIPYLFNNIERTYCADFLVEDKILVEIKPLKLQNTNLNLAKFEAARSFCSKENLQFLVTVPPKLDSTKLVQLYDEGNIKLTKKWDNRFKELRLQNKLTNLFNISI